MMDYAKSGVYISNRRSLLQNSEINCFNYRLFELLKYYFRFHVGSNLPKHSQFSRSLSLKSIVCVFAELQ